MTTAQLVVTTGGLILIGWIIWYFFLAGRTSAVAAGRDVQQLTIEVRGGYTPAIVTVQAGRPVRLDFHRTEANSCTEEVVIPEFGIRRFLPQDQTTAVEFTPRAPGTFEFTCGMGMVHGTLIVEAGAGPAATA